jgi:cytochrome c peroxidase
LSSRPSDVVPSAARPRAHGHTLALASLALAVVAAGCGAGADELFCDGTGCGFSDEQWARLSALANLPPVPNDPSNGVFDDPYAHTLGQKFFQDTRFSGPATQVDALGRPASVGRAPKGQPTNLSCVSCHDLGRMGIDTQSTPGNVSSGAGWTDVNALSVVDAAYQHLYFWNGRADSLWSLAFAVAESGTTMNGNRLQTARVIADNYRDDYEMAFGRLGQHLPIPPDDTVCAASKLVVKTGPTAGQCMDCNAPGCRPVSDQNGLVVACWPTFPLQGKPGSKPGCQPGDATEPFGDAFDCMDPDAQTAITQVLTNWAMALESYEAGLVNAAGTPFDDWINAGPLSTPIDESARRGAQLFVGKGGCVDCHSGPLFSDQQFHNIGVAQVGPNVPTLADCREGTACDCVTPGGSKCLPWGQYDGLKRLQAAPNTRRTGRWSDDPNDMSRAADVAAPLAESMKGAWRTPSLRNVAETGPYMHDGRYATLEEVVWHYNRGPEPDAVGTPDVRIRPLALTDGEQTDLVAFLHTLSGPPLPLEDTTPKDGVPISPVCQ